MSVGLIYLNLIRPVLEKYPRVGEITIRQGLRAYGKFRGEHIREWHKELGLPINVYSLINWWDVSSARTSGCFDPEAERVFQPQYNTAYRVVHPATHCPIFDVVRENDFEHYGYMYCDEIHQAICQAYHPDGIVEIRECLMKNDPYCHFTWMMPPEIPEDEIDRSAYERMEKWEKENPEEVALLYAKRDVIQTGIMYYFLARAIVDRFSSEGKGMVEASLREMGKMRGRELKQKLAKAKVDLSVENIFNNFDLPYKKVWKMDIKSSNDKSLADVTCCPLAEVWHDLNDTEIGPMYCRTQYEAVLKELSSEAEIEILQTMAEGASKCRLEFKIENKVSR